MPPAGNQMCARTTCWPGGRPAVKQEAPSPSTSSSRTEPTPAPTSPPHVENNTQRRASSGGNSQRMSTVNNCDVNEMCDFKSCKRKRETTHGCMCMCKLPSSLIFLLTLHTVPQSTCRTGQKNWTAPQSSQDRHLGV